MRRWLLGSSCALLVLCGVAATRGQSAPVNGALWVWGSNASGQLGTPVQNSYVPSELEDFPDAIAVAAGWLHTLVLRADGSVWAWGDNANGQLGQGNTDPSLTPLQVPGLSGVSAISAGGDFNLAFRQSDGKLWAWGSNSNGQLGQPLTLTYSSTPLEITSLPPIVAFDAGRWHGLALDTTGKLWAWGADFYGQLGDGGTTDSPTPIAVNLPKPVTAFCASMFHNFAVDQDGGVWGFGLNSFGQLGLGFQTGWTEPVPPTQVPGLPPIRKVTAGALHSLALTRTGDVWGWGYNTSGQVGDGSVLPANTGRLHAVKLAVSDVVDIDANNLHALARTASGELWTWGGAIHGATGENSQYDSRVPTRVPGVSGVTLLAAGGSHSVVMATPRPALKLLASGDNSHGQLGDGTQTSSASSVSTLLGDVIAVSAGATHSLAIEKDGSLWAWGNNEDGQLGIAGGDRPVPVTVSLPLAAGQRVARVAAGAHHSLAVRSDGTVWAWGKNARGQLGDGTTNDSATPVQVVGIDHVAAVAVSEAHSLALKNDGSVWAWGDNSCLQLAQPASVDMSALPVQVTPLYGGLSIAAGSCHSLALVTYGSLRVWGSNERGQFGTGSVGGRQATPLQVPELTDVVSIAAGTWHSLVLRSDGSVWGFGDASSGQLGDGTHYDYASPRHTREVGPAKLVAAGAFDGLAAADDVATWSWGSADAGQLALGGSGEYSLPEPTPISGTRWLAAGATHSLFAVAAPSP